MSDTERESQLSAMFDGELPPSECELLARRLSRDENLRRSWGHYALIGAVMRGEPAAATSLAPRVRAALNTPAHRTSEDSDRTSQRALPAGARRWLLPFSAVGAAAAVAVVALFLVRPSAEQPLSASSEQDIVNQDIVDQIVVAPEPIAVAAADPVRTERERSEPQSYVTPQAQGSGGPLLGPDVELAHFMRAHSAVSPPMVRHGALSSGVVASESVR